MSDYFPQRRIQESNILEDSIDGLKSSLARIVVAPGAPPARVVFGSVEYAQRQLEKDYGKVEYPFIALMLQTLNVP